MQITLPRGELKQAMQGISKVGGRSTIPVLGCARIDAGPGGVVAQATNLDEVVECRFDDATVKGEGACIIPLTELKGLAKGSKDECIDIDANDPLDISVVNHVGGHAVKRTVPGMDLDEWPSLSTAVETKPAAGFLETYRRLIPFSSSDETRYTLNGVFVELGTGPTPVSMTSTDGRRLCSINSMAFAGLTKSVIVPVSKFLNWSRLPTDIEIGVREDDGIAWLGVKAGAFVYAIKTIDGTYPNYRQVIPAEAGDHVITFGDDDVDLLKKVLPTFPGDDGITLVGGDGKVTIYGSGVDDQTTSLQLDSSTFEGKRMFVGLDGSYLLDAMAAGFREFAVADDLSPLVSLDGNGGLHVQMPLRGVRDPNHVDEADQSTAVAVVETSVTPETTRGPNVESKPPAKKPTTRRKRVTQQNEQKNDVQALDRVLTACNAAKSKVKEAGQSLTELATAIRDAAREQKVQGKEIESARAALSKLQSISL